MVEVLRLLYPGITNPECNRIYDLVDANRSGEITFEEYPYRNFSEFSSIFL